MARRIEFSTTCKPEKKKKKKIKFSTTKMSFQYKLLASIVLHPLSSRNRELQIPL
jgi:hypothetical protein